MEQVEFLRDLLLIFAWSAIVVFVFDKIKIPAIVGFLVSGVALGPHGLSLVQNQSTVETLAEIGVVLLMFTVGLEFSMTKMYRMKKMVLVGGTVQVGLTVLAVAGVAYLALGDAGKAFFIGFLVALSSTAVVLKVLTDGAQVNTQQGQNITGILIFQDLCAVPMMLLIPFLAGTGATTPALLPLVLKAALVVAAVLVAARWVVPHLLFHTLNTRNRELFIMVILLMCLGTAYLTFEAGLSLALGAFLAGMMIADSEYSHQVVSEILPFRDILNALFFVSIGMLLDVRYAFEHLPFVLMVTAGIILIKLPGAGLPGLLLDQPLRFSVVTGLALAQIGEFSFVLAKSGIDAGIDMGPFYQAFLAAAVITMAATPFMMAGSPRVAAAILRRLPRWREPRVTETGDAYGPIRDHVIVVGFGLNGKHMVHVLRASGVPYNILEIDPATVREQIKLGEPIHFGDATHDHVLKHVSLDKARVMVVAISDPAVERRVVSTARRLNPRLHIIVRTRYVREIEPLTALGANEVIPEEFETSIEIFSHVLQVYNVPSNIIMEHIKTVREGKYHMLRSMPVKKGWDNPLGGLLANKMGMETVEVPPGAKVAGKKLSELNLRALTGATVLAVQRQRDLSTNPAADFALLERDIVYIVGNPIQIKGAAKQLKELAAPPSE